MKKLFVLLAFVTLFIGCNKTTKTPTLEELGRAMSAAKDTSELRNYFVNPDLAFKYFYKIFVQDPSNLPLRVSFYDPKFNQTNDTAIVTIISYSPNSIELSTKISVIKKDGNILIDYLSNIHFDVEGMKSVELPVEFKVIETNDSTMICVSQNLFFGREKSGVKVVFEIAKDTPSEVNKELFNSVANKDEKIIRKGIFTIDLIDYRRIFQEPGNIYGGFVDIYKAKPVKIGW